MIQVKNKVQLIGKIDEPKITVTESNIKIAEFHILILNSFYNDEGIKIQENMNHLCKAHGKLAEIVERFCIKNMEIALEGSLISFSSHPKEITNPTIYVQVSDLLILSKRS